MVFPVEDEQRCDRLSLAAPDDDAGVGAVKGLHARPALLRDIVGPFVLGAATLREGGSSVGGMFSKATGGEIGRREERFGSQQLPEECKHSTRVGNGTPLCLSRGTRRRA